MGLDSRLNPKTEFVCDSLTQINISGKVVYFSFLGGTIDVTAAKMRLSVIQWF